MRTGCRWGCRGWLMRGDKSRRGEFIWLISIRIPFCEPQLTPPDPTRSSVLPSSATDSTTPLLSPHSEKLSLCSLYSLCCPFSILCLCCFALLCYLYTAYTCSTLLLSLAPRTYHFCRCTRTAELSPTRTTATTLDTFPASKGKGILLCTLRVMSFMSS